MAGGRWRQRSLARRGAASPALVLLAAACVLFASAAPAACAPRNTRSAAPVSRPHRGVSPVIPAAPATAPVIPVGRNGIGICQCIADHNRREINCLGSADACKATCGDHYSFVPDAPSCPVTAQVGGQ